MPKHYYNQIIRKRLAWILMYYQSRNASKVCRYFGIARKTFYKWLNRYEASGNKTQSLLDKSKKPKNSPTATRKDFQKLIIKLRKATGFGPDRLRLFLIKDYGIYIPKTTIYAILITKEAYKKA